MSAHTSPRQVTRLRRFPAIGILMAALLATPAHAADRRYTGTTAQGQRITLTVSGSSVSYKFRFRANCDGDTLTIPIEGSVAPTETGAFFDEGTFASGTATYRITGERPVGRL